MSSASRVWEIWPGNQQFCLDGRLMLGPRSEAASNACIWCALTIVPGLFYTFIAPLLLVKMPYHTGHASLAAVVVLHLASLAAMGMCTMTDPGVIPPARVQRQLRRRQTEEEAQENGGGGGEGEGSGDGAPSVPSLVSLARSSWCHTCQIDKPPGAHHCRICNSCVMEFDHHCGVVGVCIAGRNMRAFVWLLLSSSCLSATCAALACAHAAMVFHDKYTSWDGLTHTQRTLLLAFLAVSVSTPCTVCCRACVGRRNMVGVYASTGLVMMVLANLGMGFLWGHGAEAFKYNPLGIILFPSLAGLAIGLGFFAAYIIHGVCTDQSTKVRVKRHQGVPAAPRRRVDRDNQDQSREVLVDVGQSLRDTNAQSSEPFCGGICLNWNDQDMQNTTQQGMSEARADSGYGGPSLCYPLCGRPQTASLVDFRALVSHMPPEHEAP
mmetsp:Transcript_7381/g.13901  ORF Transcript_7381/g.13901 Transcript_7381/m.13901 type:complete len:437 (-) Transcript_7381:205-1515(-)